MGHNFAFAWYSTARPIFVKEAQFLASLTLVFPPHTFPQIPSSRLSMVKNLNSLMGNKSTVTLLVMGYRYNP